DPATGDVTLTQAGADLVNGGGDLPKVEVTVTDPSNATGTDSEAVAATTQTNDAPTLDVTAAAAFNENDAVAGTVVATFTAADEEDGTPTVDF
ncbi:MAG: hypothetical protein PHQ90_02080, partial [Sulfuricurvum sp.]|nr:hypothetical protein [Sulfuricurvum sp.]